MSKTKTLKLYELPQRKDTRLYGFKGLDGDDVIIIFGHLDGAYSYCWIKDEPEKQVHLWASTPFTEYKDGYKVVE